MPPIGVAIGMGLLGAGTSLAGAKMASNASKDAAKQQQASVNQAQQFNQEAWRTQQAALNPYVQAGHQQLGSLMSQFGGRPLQNPYAPSGVTNAGMPDYTGRQGMPPGGPMPPTMPVGTSPRHDDFYPKGGGQMVTMRAPTGETTQVPAHLAAEFEKRGAERVM